MFVSKIGSFTHGFKLNSVKPSITNIIFKCHYKVTVVILVTLFVFVCSNEYFGDKIKCIADEGLPASVANTYCYFIGTFTIVRHYNEDLLVSGMLPHPGVGPRLKTDDVFMHHYYQWVPLVLIMQAICFYAPYSVWKNKEGGRMQSIIDSLHLSKFFLPNEHVSVAGHDIQSKKELERRLRLVNVDLFFRLTLSRHWSAWLMRMEVINFLHVMLQIWLTNIFLNGKFIGLGGMILSKNWNHIADPLEFVFPKVTKCEFHKYGPSGTVQKYDSLCVMALNIIHEKVYMILWFWFLILFILSLLVLIWRLMQYCLYHRSFFINTNANFFWKFNVSRYMKLNPDSSLKTSTLMVLMFLNYEDWLFLRYLSKNMNGFAFQELFRFLTEDIQQKMDKTNYDYGANLEASGSSSQPDNGENMKIDIPPEPLSKQPEAQPLITKMITPTDQYRPLPVPFGNKDHKQDSFRNNKNNQKNSLASGSKLKKLI